MSARLRAIARETVEIAERGSYRDPDGAEVRLDVQPAIAGTRLYLPEDELPAGAEAGAGAGAEPTIEVTGESSLIAAKRLGGDVAVLVFASARNPGGGFLNGAQAQEESLARGSALYPCLRAAGDFYAHHRATPELTYTDRVIYSPGVPVFRDDKGRLLTEAYPVTFLTSAAPNLAAIRRTQPELAAQVPAVLRRRARASADRARRVGMRGLRQRPRDRGRGLRGGAPGAADGPRGLRRPRPEPGTFHRRFRRWICPRRTVTGWNRFGTTRGRRGSSAPTPA